MKILLSGSHGLIGSALAAQLEAGGHDVYRLVRQPVSLAKELRWDPSLGVVATDRLRGFEGVVHLAGESIAEGRWTAAKKERIRTSRIKSTRLLADTLAQVSPPPKVFVVASAIGYFGDRGDETLTETSEPGKGFLPDVCQAWEAAADPAKEKGIRVVHTRFGIVLDKKGGALAKMLLPFKLGLGGVIGSGRQVMSWVALEDVARVLVFALENSALRGPVNVVAPNPVTHREFTKALGRALRRPTLLPMPAFAARLVFGEMADALLLSSTRVLPAKLKAAGFSFRYSDLDSALRAILA